MANEIIPNILHWELNLGWRGPYPTGRGTLIDVFPLWLGAYVKEWVGRLIEALWYLFFR